MHKYKSKSFVDISNIKKEFEIFGKVNKNKRSPIKLDTILIKIAIKNNIPKKTVKEIIKDFFEIVSIEAKKYSHVTLYGLGTFKEKVVKEKYVKPPNKKKFVKTRKRKYLSFKSSFSL